MKQSLQGYVNKWEDRLNLDLMYKNNDEPLVDYIVEAWKSLEVVPNIKFISYTYTEKESEIDINKHIFKREKKKKKKDRHLVKDIYDTRCGLLTINLEITMLEKDMETGEKKYAVYPIKKAMLIPLMDKDGCYTIKGKKFYLLYQMLEKSSYTSSSAVTLKSLK